MFHPLTRALVATLAACASLAYIGWLQWESLIVAFVAFFVGLACGLPQLKPGERTLHRENPPGMN